MKALLSVKWTGRWAALGAFVAAGAMAPWMPRPSVDSGAEEFVAAATVEGLEEGAPMSGEGAVRPGDEAEAPSDAEPEVKADVVLESVRGESTFYADYFEGRTTASGLPFRQKELTAAHRSYPFGTLLRVTNLRNDRSVDVRVTDRGPFGARAKARGTIIDLSRRAARELDFVRAGRTPVRVEVLEWGEGRITPP